ncbi:MAG: carbon-nitrogen hydrolase family protein [Ferruginibacter sp.]
MKLAIVQFESVLNKAEENLQTGLNYIDQAALAGADLVCFPEAFTTTIDLANISLIAEMAGGNIVSRLKQQARKSGIHVCAGFVEKENEKIYSSVAIIDNNGDVLGIYRRIHVFQLEKGFLNAGAKPLILELSFGKVGIIVGYDIYFPELCRKYFKENVELILCPGIIPAPYTYTTRKIIQARAIENNCYLAFISHVGFNLFANFAYMGNSMVTVNPTFYSEINPDFEDGDEILKDGSGDMPEMLICDLDLKELRRQNIHNPQFLDIQLI